MFAPNNYSLNPATRELVHNPTAAWLRYDEDYRLKLLTPQIVESDLIPQIMAGAAEVLQRERGRDSRIRFAWADKAGRAGQ
jgi:hypothetical protein